LISFWFRICHYIVHLVENNLGIIKFINCSIVTDHKKVYSFLVCLWLSRTNLFKLLLRMNWIKQWS
jgi:hypothetical protein